MSSDLDLKPLMTAIDATLPTTHEFLILVRPRGTVGEPAKTGQFAAIFHGMNEGAGRHRAWRWMRDFVEKTRSNPMFNRDAK